RLELWEWKARTLLREAPEVKGIKVVSHIEDVNMKDAQAFAIYLVEKNPGTIALIAGENYVLFAKNEGIEGISMKELLRRVLERTGGGGGGSDNLAKGGGFKATPEEILKIALEELKSLI
ncbi:alanyl-tRNA editing protein AlaX, partial [Thermococci archaeon]